MAQEADLRSVRLEVEGMTCGSCVQSIEQRVGGLPGVVHIKVLFNIKDTHWLRNAAYGPVFNHSHVETDRTSLFCFTVCLVS